MAEFLLRSQPRAQHFHQGYLEPIGGSILLPTAPGLGITLDEAKIERRVDL